MSVTPVAAPATAPAATPSTDAPVTPAAELVRPAEATPAAPADPATPPKVEPPKKDEADAATLRRLTAQSVKIRELEGEKKRLDAALTEANQLKSKADRADAIEAAVKTVPGIAKLMRDNNIDFRELVAALSGEEQDPTVTEIKREIADLKARDAAREEADKKDKAKRDQDAADAALKRDETESYNTISALIDTNAEKWPIVAKGTFNGTKLRDVAMVSAIDQAHAYVIKNKIQATEEQAVALISQFMEQLEAQFRKEFEGNAALAKPTQADAPATGDATGASATLTQVLAGAGRKLGIPTGITSDVRGPLPPESAKPPMSGGSRRLGMEIQR